MKLGRQLLSVGLAASGAAWVVSMSALGAQAPAKTVNDGVYSSSQATRGQALFQSICTTCHDTGRFTGDEFVTAFSGKPLSELFKAVQTMPEDNPGSLTAQQYGDVIAFFLSLNKFPAGAEELKGDVGALGSIQMEPARP
jgi:mono/diheme cytochrome c family protein